MIVNGQIYTHIKKINMKLILLGNIDFDKLCNQFKNIL